MGVQTEVHLIQRPGLEVLQMVYFSLEEWLSGASRERRELRRVLKALLSLPTQTSAARAGMSTSSLYGFRDKDCFRKMTVAHFRL